jgi:hypothetical protein
MQISPESLLFQNGAVFSFVSPRGRSSLSSARTDSFPLSTLNTNGGTGYHLPFKSFPAAAMLAEEEDTVLRRRHQAKSSEVRTRTDAGRISGVSLPC